MSEQYKLLKELFPTYPTPNDWNINGNYSNDTDLPFRNKCIRMISETMDNLDSLEKIEIIDLFNISKNSGLIGDNKFVTTMLQNCPDEYFKDKAFVSSFFHNYKQSIPAMISLCSMKTTNAYKKYIQGGYFKDVIDMNILYYFHSYKDQEIIKDVNINDSNMTVFLNSLSQNTHSKTSMNMVMDVLEFLYENEERFQDLYLHSKTVKRLLQICDRSAVSPYSKDYMSGDNHKEKRYFDLYHPSVFRLLQRSKVALLPYRTIKMFFSETNDSREVSVILRLLNLLLNESNEYSDEELKKLCYSLFREFDKGNVYGQQIYDKTKTSPNDFIEYIINGQEEIPWYITENKDKIGKLVKYQKLLQ